MIGRVSEAQGLQIKTAKKRSQKENDLV